MIATKKQILLVFTGGTIGSSIGEHTIDTDVTNQSKLLALYRENYPRAAEVCFHPIAPVEILSENLFPSVWEHIFAAIDAAGPNQFDGVVVTHGTDTLAFSACAFSFYYTQIKIPLVLVSSNYPLTEPHANGLANFNAALEFIFQRREAGVFAAYRNPGEAVRIHLGSRLSSCLPLSSAFISIQAKAYLEYNGTEFILLNPAPALPSPQPVQLSTVTFSKRILLIKAYPGLNYAHFDLTHVDAVLHELYHSGTACVTGSWGEDYSLIHFIKRCDNLGIPVYLAPAWHSADAYASTQAMLAQGAKMIWNTSIEAAYVKLLLAYGNFEEAQMRQRFIDQNIANEQLESTLK